MTKVEKIVLAAIVVIMLMLSVSIYGVIRAVGEVQKNGDLSDQVAEGVGEFIGKVQRAADQAAEKKEQ